MIVAATRDEVEGERVTAEGRKGNELRVKEGGGKAAYAEDRARPSVWKILNSSSRHKKIYGSMETNQRESGMSGA